MFKDWALYCESYARRQFLHPQFRVSSINIKTRQYNAQYVNKTPSGEKNIFQVLIKVRGYMHMVATPLLAAVEVVHHQLSQQ